MCCTMILPIEPVQLSISVSRLVYRSPIEVVILHPIITHVCIIYFH